MIFNECKLIGYYLKCDETNDGNQLESELMRFIFYRFSNTILKL